MAEQNEPDWHPVLPTQTKAYAELKAACEAMAAQSPGIDARGALASSLTMMMAEALWDYGDRSVVEACRLASALQPILRNLLINRARADLAMAKATQETKQ